MNVQNPDNHRSQIQEHAETLQKEAISLSKLETCIPPTWLRYVVNPNDTYISYVRPGIEKLGINPGLAFDGFKGVPRYFHPKADGEGLAASLKLICWYFYFDDPFDGGHELRQLPSLCERMVHVLEGSLNDPSSPTEKLCADFREHTKHLAGEVHKASWNRFLQDCINWVYSIKNINRRFLDKIPTLEEYNKLRTINVGIIPEYSLNEIIGGFSVTDTFREQAAVKRYGELAALTIAYFNDVYSYERENQEKTQWNSIELRRRAENTSLLDAFNDQILAIQEMIAGMISIENDLRRTRQIGFCKTASGIPEFEHIRAQTRYISGIRDIVVGNHLWSLRDGRYHSLESPFFELRNHTPERRTQVSGLRIHSND